MLSAWREDLSGNSSRSGVVGALTAWIANPGFKVVILFRLAKLLAGKGPIGRAASLLCWSRMVRQGCYLSLAADIEPGFRLPHPVGIVVGDGVRIGRNVTVYQNVTLGRAGADNPQYPIIEDEVVIYAGAVVIGNVRIGKGAVIGANAVVNLDVSPGDVVAGQPARSLRRNGRAA